jgi:hypothetical protein
MDPRINQLIAADRLQNDIAAARQAKAATRTRRRDPRPTGRRFVRQIATLQLR